MLQWIDDEKLDAVVGCGVNIAGLSTRLHPDLVSRITWVSIDTRNAPSAGLSVPALLGELGRRAIELLVLRLQINLRGLPPNPVTTFFPVEWREIEK
jgi:hypothetical protein